MKKPFFSYPSRKYRGKTKWITFIGVALLVGVVLSVNVIIWGIICATQQQSRINVSRVKKVLAVENRKLSHYPPIKTKKYVTINLINGTGNIEHEEKIIKTLVESGYRLLNIESSKASVFEDTGTTITSNADFETIVENIKDVLKPIIPEIADGIPNNDPNFDSGFDVVIIIGRRVTNTIMPKQSASLP